VQRVAVVGSGGAGRSVFSKELGRRTGLAVIHLDRHHWAPGWVETPAAEWRVVQAGLLGEERWIVDGNYGGTFDIRFERADTVIVLAIAPWRCVVAALRRSLQNRGKAVQADGCPERVDVDFLRWIWRYPANSRPRLDEALKRYAGGLRIVELRTRRETAAFLDSVAVAVPAGPRSP
jgi:adenylate kinase family enzyme